MRILSIAFTLFLLMDSLGNIPLYITFLKETPRKKRRFVICRELLIALFIIVLFNFLGNGLMQFLHIGSDTIQIAGGIILFLICLRMIFPKPRDPKELLEGDQEPFIVPLAVPLIAGPSVLAAVMIYTKQESSFTMLLAIFIAWLASLVILLSSSLLERALGKKGLIATERLMGLILILVAVQMFLTGLGSFMQGCASGV